MVRGDLFGGWLMPEAGLPPETSEQRAGVNKALALRDDQGRVVANARCGVYAFYDFDGEPIYVGQTREQLRVRIGRHLTGQRSDSVAKNVLDPFEVAEIEMWPLWQLEDHTNINDPSVKAVIDGTEVAVYAKVLADSTFGAVLNEGGLPNVTVQPLGVSHRVTIVEPDSLLYLQRSHPDVRIARRATTIAALARNIAERDVSLGLRKTLLTQARRLEWLARQRYMDVTGQEPPPMKEPD